MTSSVDICGQSNDLSDQCLTTGPGGPRKLTFGSLYLINVENHCFRAVKSSKSKVDYS